MTQMDVPGIARAHTSPQTGLILAALGVVFGDLGTSPLYTMRECFGGSLPLPPTPDNVLGILSLVFWSLTLVITIKYVLFVMRADNHGEGGILALMALVLRTGGEGPARRRRLLVIGLAGAALFYGDGMVTPAISVLSAVEGLAVAAPSLSHMILPVAITVLVVLFVGQHFGTALVGKAFGPVMCLWFACIAVLGIGGILRAPSVLQALDPQHAINFLLNHGWRGFTSLGAVVLALTGAEALYADMGHFGARAIRLSWFALVLPALLLNYFGQGALILIDPAAVQSPFFLLAPDWGLYPLVALSTLAAVIASQAVISGAFSMTRQAILLGYCPRMPVRHTSRSEIGQIYIPRVNTLLLVAVVALVIGFRSSSNLAAAYGIAVTGTMVMTTVLVFFVMRDHWGWNPLFALVLAGSFIAIDLSFLGANLLKFFDGGWFPLAAGIAMFTLMWSWKQGRESLLARLSQSSASLDSFVASLTPDTPRLGHPAIYLTGSRHGVPHALTHNQRHNCALHRQVVVVTVATEDVPFVPEEHRILVRDLGKGFYRILMRYGFMEQPDIPAALIQSGVPIDLEQASYFVARESLMTGHSPGFPQWRQRLFTTLSHNATSATDFFNIPPDRVVEMGIQVRL